MIRLQSIYAMPVTRAAEILWDLLAEREPEASISHREMPTREEHGVFVTSNPYRVWYFIRKDDEASPIVGACYLTWNNEIGVQLFEGYQGQGLGSAAVEELIGRHSPEPSVPGKRPGHYVANVSPSNVRGQAFWHKMGGPVVQLTYKVTR